MKFKSFFLLSISLTTVSSLVDIHPASAQRNPVHQCTGSGCPVITPTGPKRGGGTREQRDFVRSDKKGAIAKTYISA